MPVPGAKVKLFGIKEYYIAEIKYGFVFFHNSVRISLNLFEKLHEAKCLEFVR